MIFIIVCLICWDLVLTALVAFNMYYQFTMTALQNDLNQGVIDAFKKLVEREAQLFFRGSHDKDQNIQEE